MLTKLCMLTVVSGCSSWYVMKPSCSVPLVLPTVALSTLLRSSPGTSKSPPPSSTQGTHSPVHSLCAPTAICGLSPVSSTPWGEQASPLCKCMRMCWEKVLRKDKLSCNTVPGNQLIRYLRDIIVLPSFSSPGNQQRNIYHAPYLTCTHNSCST